MSKTRIASIETFRVIAVFAVICIHATPFLKLEGYQLLGYIIRNACRFAVPFFFVTSGYFFGVSLRQGASLFSLIGRYLARLWVLFLGWSFIYGVLPDGILKTGAHGGFGAGWGAIHEQVLKTCQFVMQHSFRFLMEGTKYHLWFFAALMMGLLIVSVVIWIKRQKYLLLISFILVLAGFWVINDVFFHIALSRIFSMENKFFYSSLLVGLGGWLSGRENPPMIWIAVSLIVIGFFMRMTEAFVFWDYFGNKPFWPGPFTLGAISYGVGVFLLALACPHFGESTLLQRMGTLTLGIYASHVFVKTNFVSAAFLSRFLGAEVATIILPFMIFFLAAGLTLLLRHFRPTRFLVT